MAVLPSGDWTVQAGAGYFANGLGAYPTGGSYELDIVDILAIASSKYIKLYNSTEYATITKTASALSIINGYDAIDIDAETEINFLFNGDGRAKVDTNGLTIQTGKKLIVSDDSNTEFGNIYKDGTYLYIENLDDDIIIDAFTKTEFHINGTKEVSLDDGGLNIHGAGVLTLYSSGDSEDAQIYRDATALVLDSGTGGILHFKIASGTELELSDTALYPTSSLGLDLGDSTHIFEDTYSESFYQYLIRWMNPPLDGAVNTNDGTNWTTIATTPNIPSNEAWMIKAYVIGYATSSAVSAWEIVGTYYVTGGNATQVTTPTKLIEHETGTSDIQMVGSSAAVLVQVKDTGINTRWTVNFDITRVPMYTA